mmetsp:Transcript_21539/g.61652  ORF Transcript_21539/g.61652 Transcript_21539/m.61652 type:complete len:214 (+) Transcript_21539:402-1043(+)
MSWAGAPVLHRAAAAVTLQARRTMAAAVMTSWEHMGVLPRALVSARRRARRKRRVLAAGAQPEALEPAKLARAPRAAALSAVEGAMDVRTRTACSSALRSASWENSCSNSSSCFSARVSGKSQDMPTEACSKRSNGGRPLSHFMKESPKPQRSPPSWSSGSSSSASRASPTTPSSAAPEFEGSCAPPEDGVREIVASSARSHAAALEAFPGKA